MNSHKLVIALLIIFISFGCSPATITPNIQASPTKVTAPATKPPTPSVTVVPSATLDPDAPEGCVNLVETPLNTEVLNGLIIVYDSTTDSVYFFDPKSNQLLDIEKQTKLSWDTPDTDVSTTKVSPNKKIVRASVTGKNYDIIRTVDKIIKTDDTQGQENWNRGRWLDNEHMFFQDWLAPYDSSIVIYNPFTGEQKNIRTDLPNPYIVEDTGGQVSWLKADIDPSLKRVLYNDKDERLVLWDLNTQKEIGSLSSPTDLTQGTWSPNGEEFAIPWLSPTYDPIEYFIIDMDGTVKKTSFNQKHPFANVSTRPSWSPDGRRIAYWLKISNDANADPETLRQWLAITDTTTLDTQLFCLSPNKPPKSGGRIVWSPDSQQVIVNTGSSSGEAKPTLVDLTHLTQSMLDTHGLTVSDWMAP